MAAISVILPMRKERPPTATPAATQDSVNQMPAGWDLYRVNREANGGKISPIRMPVSMEKRR